jgi:hypothetical protein
MVLPFAPLESPSLPEVALPPNITRRNNARMACTSAEERPASVNLSYACGVADPSWLAGCNPMELRKDFDNSVVWDVQDPFPLSRALQNHSPRHL